MTVFSRTAAAAIATLLATSTPIIIPSVQAQVTERLQPMTVARLDQILRSEVSNIDVGDGQWQFRVNERAVIVLADARNNRMRVFSPVIPVDELTPLQIQSMLAANFHSALDARYAITDGAVVAVYLHPLTTLQTNDFRSALRQVVSLAETFGTSYSSNTLNFGLRQRQVPSDLEEI